MKAPHPNSRFFREAAPHWLAFYHELSPQQQYRYRCDMRDVLYSDGKLRARLYGHYRCGAKRKRDGQPCRARALANGRCRFHGGLSTGPRTAEGKARALANLRQYRTDPANLPNDFDKIRGP